MINGKKLTNPSWHEPYLLIGESKALDPSGKAIYDLGKVSKSDKINRWSPIKPTANLPFFVEGETAFKDLAGQSGVDFGFDFAKILRQNVVEAADAAAENENTWPVKTDPEPRFSLSHWNGYDHGAVPVGGLTEPLKDLDVIPGQEVTVYFQDTGSIRMTDFARTTSGLKWFVALIYGTTGSIDQQVITHVSDTPVPAGQKIVQYDQITFTAPDTERPYTMIQGLGNFPSGGTESSIVYMPFTLRKLNVSANPWSATQRFVFGGPNWDLQLKFTYAEASITVVNNRTYAINVVPFVEYRLGEDKLPLRLYVGTNNGTLTAQTLGASSRNTYTVRHEVSETLAQNSNDYRVGVVVDGMTKYLTDWFNAQNYVPSIPIS